MVPVVVGSVVPPVVERLPAADKTTVPEVADCTATLPKFISAVWAILIGVRMVALAVAVAVSCADKLCATPSRAKVATKH